ncbi:MAG: hypothetical protein DRP85_02505 [Candidatus Makaraimicrobium thalassicum]|nr:MAG: hypothetical protein DRP85_02505 [Candidatus Omnitrophota bacterium]
MRFELLYMQILCLGLLILAAYFGGKLTRRLRIGEVVGQVLGGLVVGPFFLFFLEHKVPVYREALLSLHFLAFVFLSIIALLGLGVFIVLRLVIERKWFSPKEKNTDRAGPQPGIFIKTYFRTAGAVNGGVHNNLGLCLPRRRACSSLASSFPDHGGKRGSSYL